MIALVFNNSGCKFRWNKTAICQLAKSKIIFLLLIIMIWYIRNLHFIIINNSIQNKVQMVLKIEEINFLIQNGRNDYTSHI